MSSVNYKVTLVHLSMPYFHFFFLLEFALNLIFIMKDVSTMGSGIHQHRVIIENIYVLAYFG